MEQEMPEKSVKTYRFKISNEDLYNEMILFSDKNRFLNKEDLKEAYEKWIEEPYINSMVRGEEEMLKKNNYNLGKNNISQKIFKSIKYYHIKKITSKTLEKKQQNATENCCQKEKRKKGNSIFKRIARKR